jgi:hypothetical protein
MRSVIRHAVKKNLMSMDGAEKIEILLNDLAKKK